MTEQRKARVATVSLAGCFGCHMAILDMDERLVALMQKVEIDRSPLTDIKTFTRRCDIGIIEGGCCNEENVHVLQDFRRNCDILIALGNARSWGAARHAQRDHAFRRPAARLSGRGLYHRPLHSEHHPPRPQRPRPAPAARPGLSCSDVVHIDHQIPGCAPSGVLIHDTLVRLLAGRFHGFDPHDIRFD